MAARAASANPETTVIEGFSTTEACETAKPAVFGNLRALRERAERAVGLDTKVEAEGTCMRIPKS